MKSAIFMLGLMAASIMSPQLLAAELGMCHVFMLCDDEGELFVNGKSVLKANDYQRTFTAQVVIQSGDVLAATVTDKQGGSGGFWSILILRDDKTLVASKDFSYNVAPNPDWKTDVAMKGFKKPRLSLLKDRAMGNVKKPDKAWSQEVDRTYGTLNFKCVVP